ncbi:MAG: arginine--tRNA ligase [Saezia sp.]
MKDTSRKSNGLIRDLLTARARVAVEESGLERPEGFQVQVTSAAGTRFGDYQTNVAMVLAKFLKKPPCEVAGELISLIDVGGLSLKPEIAGPGFINFRVDPALLCARIAQVANSDSIQIPQVEQQRSIVIDFSSPNVAKPMHVGHIRSTFLGDCLARIARYVGHRVTTDNHLGDWGTQFGMILYGWKNHLDQAALAADPLSEMVRVYKLVSGLCKVQPELLEAAKAELVKLQQGDAENHAIWKKSVDLTMSTLEREIYQPLDIKFDLVMGESAYNEVLPALVDTLLAQGHAEMSEGAVCIFFPDDPKLADLPPFIIRKADGGYGYASTDLATVDFRLKELQADEMWYVVGQPQQLHFQQLAAAAKKTGRKANVVFVGFGSILGSDGKMFRTRAGESVQLSDLLKEAVERAARIVNEREHQPAWSEEEKNEISKSIGLGAIKYAELSQHRLTDYKFDWDKMLSLQGNTVPYLFYSYVRSRSIFRKLDGASHDPSHSPTYTEPAELRLATLLCQFGEAVHDVLTDHRPNIICSYLYEVATAFHAFFEACPVLRAEPPARESRLMLCDATSKVLRQGLSLLGIRVVEKM